MHTVLTHKRHLPTTTLDILLWLEEIGTPGLEQRAWYMEAGVAENRVFAHTRPDCPSLRLGYWQQHTSPTSPQFAGNQLCRHCMNNWLGTTSNDSLNPVWFLRQAYRYATNMINDAPTNQKTPALDKLLAAIRIEKLLVAVENVVKTDALNNVQSVTRSALLRAQPQCIPDEAAAIAEAATLGAIMLIADSVKDFLGSDAGRSEPIQKLLTRWLAKAADGYPNRDLVLGKDTLPALRTLLPSDARLPETWNRVAVALNAPQQQTSLFTTLELSKLRYNDDSWPAYSPANTAEALLTARVRKQRSVETVHEDGIRTYKDTETLGTLPALCLGWIERSLNPQRVVVTVLEGGSQNPEHETALTTLWAEAEPDSPYRLLKHTIEAVERLHMTGAKGGRQ